MIIQRNMLSMNAYRQFSIKKGLMSDVQEKLSGGYRINRAADDAAGLSISEKMRRQIRGLNRTLDNMQEGINLCQTADGALTEVHAILQRMNELAIQAANGTNADADREAIQREINQLISEIDRTAHDTEIFGIHPLLADATITKTSFEIPQNSIHTLSNANIYDGRGSIGFMADGMSQPFAGTWTEADAKPFISVKDANGHATGKVNLTSNQAFLSYTNYTGQNRFVTSYDDGVMSFQVELTWKKIDCSTGSESREYFEASYNFINLSSQELTFDFWMEMDMLVGVASNAIPNINGAQMPNTYKWTGANIPKEMTVDNFVNLSGNVGTTVNVSAQYIWDGISNAPDVVMSGDRFGIGFDSAMDSNKTGDLGYRGNDYFYGVGWSQKKIGVGGNFVMQNRIGLYVEKEMKQTSYVIDGKVAEAIQKVSEFRSCFGAQQNRLEHAIRNNGNTAENTQAAESNLRDADMAEMMMKYSIANILAQMSQNMLVQANQQPERVLRLLI